MQQTPPQADALNTPRSLRETMVEVFLIFVVFFLVAGWPTPAINEVHYLTRAQRLWNPEWCPNDFFLNSADAHVVLNWTFGWITCWGSLTLLAWTGRIACWALMAVGWWRLSVAIIPNRLAAVLSASLFLLFVDRFQMAGEWVVGGFEAKSLAYGIVFLGMGQLVRNRWRSAWLLLGLASSFHVLVGGWATIAAGVAWLFSPRRPPLLRMTPALIGGFVLALPGLAPALMLTWSTDPEVVREASAVYVFGRLSHHLLFHQFAVRGVLLHVSLLTACLIAWRYTECPESERRLRWFVMGAVFIAVAGVVIDLATIRRPDVAAPLLRYYWFRLSDVMAPAGAALTCVALLCRWRTARPRAADALLAVAIIACAVSLGGPVVRRTNAIPGADLQALGASPQNERRARHEYNAWRNACDWVTVNTSPDACFLLPRRQQTFRWHAGRGEAVSWKDIPQEASAIVQWRRRIDAVYPPVTDVRGLAALGEARIVELAREYAADYVIVDRRRSARRLALPRVYPLGNDWNLYYDIYRIPASKDAAQGATRP